jgi:hypothetical protein
MRHVKESYEHDRYSSAKFSGHVSHPRFTCFAARWQTNQDWVEIDAISVMSMETIWSQPLYKTIRHTGFINKSDHMTNSYSIRRRTWKWMKKLFFSPSGTFSSELFYFSSLLVVQNYLTEISDLPWSRMPQLQTTPQGRPTPSTNYLTRPDIWHSEHWPSEGKRDWSHVCVPQKTKKREQNSNA